MRPLARPQLDPEVVLRQTFSRIRLGDLRERFAASVPELVGNGETLARAGDDGKLSALRAEYFSTGSLSEEDFKGHYDQRFAAEGSPGRPFYNELLLAPRFSRCPYCAVGTVSTIDHYLPKQQFPGISVLPSNLVPCCSDCNTAKRDFAPGENAPAVLHPYFDDCEDAAWLVASIVPGDPPGATFSVAPDVPPDLADRLNTHLQVFNLRRLFLSHAGELISQLDQELVPVYRGGGERAVAAHLREQAVTRSSGFKNAWIVAVLNALADSDWYRETYCSGLGS